MNTNTLKSLIIIAAIAMALGATSAMAAGDGPTGGTIGSNQADKDSAGATDVWLLSCPRGTRSARANINEGNNDEVQLSVQVINPHRVGGYGQRRKWRRVATGNLEWRPRRLYCHLA